MNWDPIHNECLNSIDAYECYQGPGMMMGPDEGHIDCGGFMGDNIHEYTAWNSQDNVCELIFEDTMEGTWRIEGNKLCIPAPEMVDVDCSNFHDFSGCECTQCSWQPQPTFENPDNGICSGGGQRVEDAAEHYKIKTVSPVFQDELIHNFIYGNSAGEKCMEFELQDNGTVKVTNTTPDGSTCTVTLIPE
tara:strand:- start:175 stop:744 length:570 start_codon:yes stop_codon:yes gene_type:complete